MKTFEHFEVYPPEDQIRFFNDWSQFNDDFRTQDLDIHLGCQVDFSKIRNDKINVHMYGEWPNSWFNGKERGQNVPLNLEIEKRFDYVLSFCKQTALGRGYLYAPYGYDFDHVQSQVDWNDIGDVNKDIDVFMCATCPGEHEYGEIHPVWPWYKTMEKFNHVFCNANWASHYVSWREKQALSSRSKISIVFTDFLGASPPCIEYAKQHFPWIKFKTPGGIDNVKPLTTQAKGRVFDAVFCKSIILCYKSPFVGELPPYNCPIEDYLDPKTDFIYFEDSKDLETKIKEILDDYDNPKYKKMVDSAYDKMKKNHDVKVIYEKYLVPLAKKGKTK